MHRPARPGTSPQREPPNARSALIRALLLRAGLLGGFWLLLAGSWAGRTPATVLADLVVGVLAAGLATWASLRLLPPSGQRLHIGALLRFVWHFLWQSAVAGLDVARRAFAPGPPLCPGMLQVPIGFEPGPGRAAFGALTSLLPGTLPVGAPLPPPPSLEESDEVSTPNGAGHEPPSHSGDGLGWRDLVLVYHCLDLRQPVAAGLARDEALLRRLWSSPVRDAHALDD